MIRAFGFIDVQNDFMNANGALYVPNAESIKENIGKLVKFAEQRKCPIFFTQDQHEQNDPEMITVGGSFPLHCLKDSPGSDNITEANTKKDYLIFTKRCYNIFDEKLGDANIVDWLKEEKVTEVWLAGVATDYCVKAAALGLLKLDIDVYIFENAIMGVAPETTEAAIKEMKTAGVHFATVNL